MDTIDPNLTRSDLIVLQELFGDASMLRSQAVASLGSGPSGTDTLGIDECETRQRSNSKNL